MYNTEIFIVVVTIILVGSLYDGITKRSALQFFASVFMGLVCIAFPIMSILKMVGIIKKEEL